EGAERRRVVEHNRFQTRHVPDLGKVIVHKAGRKQLTMLVVAHGFVQAPTHTLHHTTVDLAFQDQRVECETNVLDRDIFLQFDLSRIGVDRYTYQVGHKAGRVCTNCRSTVTDDRAGATSFTLTD